MKNEVIANHLGAPGNVGILPAQNRCGRDARAPGNVFFYNYPVCKIGIAEENGAISRVVFSGSGKNDFSGFAVAESPVIKTASTQLAEYFTGKRKEFDLPLAPAGTEFQRSVWRALQTIPYGKTRSYGEIAAQIGNPKAFRAVGLTNNRNPIVIIIPCHRVIGHDGSLVGFGGGLGVKQYLLDLENRHAPGRLL